jgi:hypothetical protein
MLHTFIEKFASCETLIERQLIQNIIFKLKHVILCFNKFAAVKIMKLLFT